jgi:hypothetical protein
VLRVKNCPRCKGDLRIDRYLSDYWYEQCIQCGYLAFLENTLEPGKRLPQPEGDLIASLENEIAQEPVA